MRSAADRITLAAITTAAVLAAFLTTTYLPAAYTPGPLLTWAVSYTVTVTALARATRLPVARSLVASTLLVAAAAEGLLRFLADVIDCTRQLLAHARSRGLTLLDATFVKAA